MDSSYIKLTLTRVPQSENERITYELFEAGAEGVAEQLNFIQTSQQYDPEIIPAEETTVNAFFLMKDKEKVELLALEDAYKNLGAEVFYEKNKDWLLEWKKHYKPFYVCDDLWVYPSWEKDKIQKGQEVILVDPGLAFGTGTHGTTNLCLKALSKHLPVGQNLEIATALDMGAGTGILSVLMSKRGVKTIVACEIDEMAREKCRENLDLNDCPETQVVSPESLEHKVYDLVVANIIDGVLLKIKKDLVVRTGKKMILSGILVENEQNVLNAFLSEDLELIHKTYKDEWVCLEFCKKNA